LKKNYKIKECESCKKESNMSPLVDKGNDKFYVQCNECEHFSKYEHSKIINENISSLFIIDCMAKSIYDLMISNSIHYLVGRNNVNNFNKLFKEENKSNLANDALEIITKFLFGEKTSCFKGVDIPLIPNYSNGIVSGLGIFEVSYSQWFFKVLATGINPFTSKACLMSDAFYDRITITKDDNSYIDWNILWKLIDKKIGLRDYRDVLESQKKRDEAAQEFYYHFALENNLQREFKEVMETKHENRSNDEKRYLSYFNMHKESDEYKARITPERDFWLECLHRPFKNHMIWNESYFNLSEWNECYWAHVLMLDRITKGHPARRNGMVYFKNNR